MVALRASAVAGAGSQRTTHHAVQVSRARTYDVTGVVPVPLGVTGNTPDSGSSGCQGVRQSRTTGYSVGSSSSVPLSVPLLLNLSISVEGSSKVAGVPPGVLLAGRGLR